MLEDESARIKGLVVKAAIAAGAAAVRVASAAIEESARSRMRAAFSRGDLASWGYDEAYADRATDPRSLLAGARSVVCVAIPYATEPPAMERGCGRVSNYAWSRDYHRRMRDLLDRIAEAIDAAVGTKVTVVACDTLPLAERAFAARAGLAWIGKHTGAIHPDLGSFVFLGRSSPA